MIRLALAVAATMGVPATPATHADAEPDAEPCSPACIQRVKARMINERRREVVRPYKAWLNSTSLCESGGRWSINTGNGFFGGMQFTLSSWQAVGGRGLPHLAGKLEQKYRAVRLLRIQGRGAWPVCG